MLYVDIYICKCKISIDDLILQNVYSVAYADSGRPVEPGIGMEAESC